MMARKFTFLLMVVLLQAQLGPGPAGQSGRAAEPKSVLVLGWYTRDHLWNVGFDDAFKSALKSTRGGAVEFYEEYLETNRFPGEDQDELMRDYLHLKYAGRRMDVVIANSDASLNFLRRYRQELFPDSPIVFIAAQSPLTDELIAGAGMAGITILATTRQTLDLALRLHPDTEHVLIISGTLEHDKRIEYQARAQLRGYDERIQIEYLTDLSLDELITKVRSLPQRSIALQIWQQSRDASGAILESAEMLSAISNASNVPVYATSFRRIWSLESESGFRSSVVGGYVNTGEHAGQRAGEIANRIMNGEHAQDIHVENAPSAPFFDWRQLQRWGIREDALPQASVIEFRNLGVWEQYKVYLLAALGLLLLQTFLIGSLLVERRNRQLAEKTRRHLASIVDSSDDAIISLTFDGKILSWNPGAAAIYGYSADEMIGRNFSQLIPEERLEEYLNRLDKITAGERVPGFETVRKRRDGTYFDVSVSSSPIKDTGHEKVYATITRDITKRRKAEAMARVSEALVSHLAGQLLNLQEEERKRIASELHDGLGQSLAIIQNRVTMCRRRLNEPEAVEGQLDELAQTISSTIDEVREIAQNLRPFELDRLGLTHAVGSMIDKVRSSTRLTISHRLDHVDGMLSRDEETGIYRIIQEGLNNIIKHAQATTANVAISRSGSQLEIVVKDNGLGFRPEGNGHPRGFGLAGIAERSRMLGATFNIVSEPGVGTELIVRLGSNDGSN